MKILTYGTFDLFHIGHLRLLERLRALGSHLTVGVSTDAFNRHKGKQCVMPFEDRAAIVAGLRCVDAVIGETAWEQKPDDIRAHGIGIFGMGDDWAGKFDHLTGHCRVVYLPRTPNISSTALRRGLGQVIHSGLAPEGQESARDAAAPSRVVDFNFTELS